MPRRIPVQASRQGNRPRATRRTAPATAQTGDAIVVPKGVRFQLGNAGDETLELLCCLPVGGQARLDDGTLLTPPWAQ